MSFDSSQIRQDFPALKQKVNNCPLIYFDNAATAHKPQVMISAVTAAYQDHYSNVHRGMHGLSMRATELFEEARGKVQKFINAPSEDECIFVSGSTQAINMVAGSFVAPSISKGDEILITTMEHHANIVPWQLVCEATGAKLTIAPLLESGMLDMPALAKLISDKTKFVAVSHVSNVLGVINDVQEIAKLAHKHGALVLVDGAQAAPHLPVDVQDLGCDFYVFSAHKVYGPTGLGILWGKAALLSKFKPYQAGGNMIETVSFKKTTYAALPHYLEAGTPNIAGVIGFGAVLDYLATFDWREVMHYEHELLLYATKRLKSLPGIKIFGDSPNKVPVISFVHESIHAHDIATILDSQGIAMRSGHHCAMPLMEHLKVAATSRVSMAFYNTYSEVDTLITGLYKAFEVFT
jgi:cysteine desulfurase / selenocysteine lyase